MSQHRVHAFALATCIMCCVVRAAHAQSGTDTVPQASAPGDSTMSYPLLTLSEVVQRALASSPIVASGVGGIRIARSSERVAFGAYLPAVAATSAATRTDAPATPAASSGTSSSGSIANSRNFGLSATVDLFTGGRRGANEALARAELLAARSGLVSDRYAVTLAAQQGFFEVIRATDRVRVARTAVAQAEQLLSYTGAMSRAGTATRSDLLRAQLQVTTMQGQLLAANDTLLAASYALGWLAGLDGAAGAKADSVSDTMRPLSLDDSSIVRLAVDASPGVVASEAAAAADAAALRAARTQYVPTISVSAAHNWAANSGASSTSTSGGTRPGWAFTIGTTYPLFNGFQREDVVTRAAVAADVAQVAARDVRRSARATAAQLLGAVRNAATAISLGTEAVRSAREDLRVQTARHRAGISTMLDVLTSESALVQAEYDLAQARHRYHVTRAALEALVGRIL